MLRALTRTTRSLKSDHIQKRHPALPQRRQHSNHDQVTLSHLEFINVPPSMKDTILKDNEIRIIPNFITPDEEESLMNEVKYEENHWDKVIVDFRETEKTRWKEENESIFRRMREMFDTNIKWLPGVHILDLTEKGYIGPHVDSIKFSGSIISGISLLSDCVMKLTPHSIPPVISGTSTPTILMHLPRGSLYWQ
ncbi:putative alpha-ketoglutarate-dependent dioxygenase ABH7-like, partial [Planoprotostelium fungivorum]